MDEGHPDFSALMLTLTTDDRKPNSCSILKSFPIIFAVNDKNVQQHKWKVCPARRRTIAPFMQNDNPCITSTITSSHHTLGNDHFRHIETLLTIFRAKMACPLSAILNPVDDPSQRATPPADGDDGADGADDAILNTSTPEELPPKFNTPPEQRRGPCNSNSNHVEPARQNDLSPIILSPNHKTSYNCRSNISSTNDPPVPPTPRKRNRSTCLPDNPRQRYQPRANSFSVFNALLNHAELTLEFTKHLHIEDLVSLYATSKDFHFLVNARFTAMILGQSIGKASESSRTFIFRCYKSLCMRDPARRLNETRPNELRFVPSFRWLRMILFRESVVDDILRCLAAEGHRLPKRASLVLKKIWFTIDVSDNARRVGLMHNEKFWGNKDLFLATMFFIKLDMRLTHPTTGNGELGLRKMLLGQRSLSMLAKVLKREEMKTQLDMLRMIVRWKYQPAANGNLSILGVPSQEVGKLQYEGWGLKDTKFIQIDELVMREGIKRRLNLQRHYLDMMIYGYINKKTFKDIPTPMPQHVEEAEEDDSDSVEGEESAEEQEGDGFFGSDVEEEANEEEWEDEMDCDSDDRISANDGSGTAANSD